MRANTEPSTSLHVGIDFSQKRADFCVLRADGEVVEAHRGFANSLSGYQQAKAYLLEALQTQGGDGLRIAAEATANYWLPFFLELVADRELQVGGPHVELFLHNARQVYWFKRGAGEDDKSDATDPYYIAEHLRTRHRPFAWSPQADWLALRFYTRLRFHLMQMLVREKNYAHACLFVRYSAYAAAKPFADLFGATSRRILVGNAPLATLAALPLAELAEQLDELSGHRLTDPEENARKLQRILAESFPCTPPLVEPVQRVLQATLTNLGFIEQQVQQVDRWIAREVTQAHPEILCLDSIPGVGLSLAAGIAAEIGDLARFFDGQKWDKRHKHWREKTLRDVEDAVAKFAGLWWPRRDSGDFVAEDRRLSKRGSRYLRYYLIEAAGGLRRNLPDYAAFYKRKFQEVTKHKHKRALVLTARKSVGLIVGLLHRQESYHAREGRAAI